MKLKLLLVWSIAFTSVAATAQSGLDKTAQQIAAEMAPGWNLGNTLEAKNWQTGSALWTNTAGLAAETSWQSTRTSRRLIDYVKRLGFRSVRIPCAWAMGHIVDEQTCQIDPQWMARVKEVVDYCIADSLYVLLNDHWDGGWLEEHIGETDPVVVAEQKRRLTLLWTQIAETFRDYDEHLLFAGLNEPHASTQDETNQLMEYHQTFVDAVRATGGNNLKRVLVIQGPSTDIDNTCKMLTRMPSDPMPDRLAVEIHFYFPWNFWGMTQDEDWGNCFYYWGSRNHVTGSAHNATYGEESEMLTKAKNLKQMFVDKGIPVINGEYTVLWRTVEGEKENQAMHNRSLQDYFKQMNRICMENGIVPMVWDTNNGRDLIDRANLGIKCPYMMEGIREALAELQPAVVTEGTPQVQFATLSLLTPQANYAVTFPERFTAKPAVFTGPVTMGNPKTVGTAYFPSNSIAVSGLTFTSRLWEGQPTSSISYDKPEQMPLVAMADGNYTFGEMSVEVGRVALKDTMEVTFAQPFPEGTTPIVVATVNRSTLTDRAVMHRVWDVTHRGFRCNVMYEDFLGKRPAARQTLCYMAVSPGTGCIDPQSGLCMAAGRSSQLIYSNTRKIAFALPQNAPSGETTYDTLYAESPVLLAELQSRNTPVPVVLRQTSWLTQNVTADDGTEHTFVVGASIRRMVDKSVNNTTSVDNLASADTLGWVLLYHQDNSTPTPVQSLQDASMPAAIYDLSGRKLSVPVDQQHRLPRGIYIIRQGRRSTKILIP